MNSEQQLFHINNMIGLKEEELNTLKELLNLVQNGYQIDQVRIDDEIQKSKDEVAREMQDKDDIIANLNSQIEILTNENTTLKENKPEPLPNEKQ
jgi:D-ribose pyranose/furanose isomerase RbsD